MTSKTVDQSVDALVAAAIAVEAQHNKAILALGLKVSDAAVSGKPFLFIRDAALYEVTIRALPKEETPAKEIPEERD